MSIKLTVKDLLGASNVQRLRDLTRPKEPAESIRQKQAFYGALIAPGDLYFDVGANFGNRVETMLDLGARVVAIDPQSECCKYLRRKFGSKISLVQKGLGEREETRELFLSDATTLSTLSSEWVDKMGKSGRFGGNRWTKKETVSISTLDKLVAEYGRPRFIKIDVEGFELEVLKGLSSPVECLSLEYAVPEQTDKLVACMDRIRTIAADKKVAFNYSVGETMEWALAEWIGYDEMVTLLRSPEFVKTDFGDIYARTSLT